MKSIVPATAISLALISISVSASAPQIIPTKIPASRNQAAQVNSKDQATIVLRGASRYVTVVTVQLLPILSSTSSSSRKSLIIKQPLRKNETANTWMSVVKLKQNTKYKIVFLARKASVALQENYPGDRSIQFTNGNQNFKFAYREKPISLNKLSNYSQPSPYLNLDAADIDFSIEDRYPTATALQTEATTILLKKRLTRVKSLISETRTSFGFLLDKSGAILASDFVSNFKPYLNFTPENSVIGAIASGFVFETRRTFEERFVDVIIKHPKFPLLLKFVLKSKLLNFNLNRAMSQNIELIVQEIIRQYPEAKPPVQPTTPLK
jgi:hypothetical protein